MQQSAADSLSKFHYPALATVTLSYPKSSIREDRLVNGELKGFCQLHPRNQGIQTLGEVILILYITLFITKLSIMTFYKFCIYSEEILPQ